MTNPEPRRLILLRHGQTAWNAEGRFQGHLDISLDSVGRKQAEAVAAVMAALSPAALWSSDLSRASETAAYVGRACGLEPVHDERLREFDVGVRSGLTTEEFAQQHPSSYAAWRASADHEVVGAECAEEVAARMLSAMRDVVSHLESGQTGIVVTHGAALRTSLVALLDWPAAQRHDLRGPANCAWTEVTIGADGSASLVSYNRTVS